MLDLKAIETFVEVADRLSFSDAARRLGLPVSTVSTRIRVLEEGQNVRLLDRSTRAVTLTVEGEIFAEHCRRALDELNTARERIGSAQEARGLVRISIPVAYPLAEFASLIGRFRRAHSGIDVQVVVEDRPASFVTEGIDLAIRGRAPGSDEVIARHLADTPVIHVSPAGRDREVPLPTLRPIESGENRRDRPEGLATKSLGLALAFVVDGQACAYLPASICHAALEAGLIEEGPGHDGVQEPLPLYLVFHSRRHQPARVKFLKEFLIQELSGHNS